MRILAQVPLHAMRPALRDGRTLFALSYAARLPVTGSSCTVAGTQTLILIHALRPAFFFALVRQSRRARP